LFEIILHSVIQKDLKGLPKLIVQRIRQLIEELRTGALLASRGEKLAGFTDVYRLKIHQSYRMAYRLDESARRITILMVGTRTSTKNYANVCVKGDFQTQNNRKIRLKET